MTQVTTGDPGPIESWDDAQTALDEVASTSTEPFDAATVTNGRELLALARTMCPPPADLAKGYWSTFRFCWPDREIEVFDDHLELYDHASREAFDVRHYPREPGQPFPPEILAALARLGG